MLGAIEQELNMAEFSGKVAFVTGAGSGIGRATATQLAAGGANVMAMDRDASGLAETVRLADLAGGEIRMVVGDVCDPAAVEHAVAETISQFGGLHAAHNNAGIVGTSGPLTGISARDFQAVMDVNVMGVFNCLKAELNHMRAAGGGAIVNTASVVGRTALPEICAYVTSKHAIVGLTKAAALENASAGIRVNSVSPGYVITNMTKEFFDEQSLAAFVTAHPIGRGSRPEEIADAVLYLLSNRSSYIVGADLVVDGGYTLA